MKLERADGTREEDRPMTLRIPCALLTLLLPIASQCVAASYSVLDLGTLGGTTSEARSINNSGQIAGSAKLADGTTRAYIYENSTMTSLGTLPGHVGTKAGSVGMSINSSGQIVGWSYGLDLRTYFYDGAMHDLGQHFVGFNQAYAINDNSQIVGAGTFAGSLGTTAFLYSGGVAHDLGTLGTGTSSLAWAINNGGQLVGESTIALGNETRHAFLYENDEMFDLGTLGGSTSRATAINNLGQIVGEAANSSNKAHAFLYENGVMHDLGSLGGNSTTALSINDLGQVVGFGQLAGSTAGRAFLYKDGVMHDMNDLIDPLSGWVLTTAADINDNGLIVGTGTIGGQLHAVLLTPVPEPSGLVLAGAVLAALATCGLLRNRKRVGTTIA
jgi:probable HAF family extracellular repeat protein